MFWVKGDNGLVPSSDNLRMLTWANAVPASFNPGLTSAGSDGQFGARVGLETIDGIPAVTFPNSTEIMRMPMPDGKLAHAEIKIGDSHIMLADESPEQASRSPQHYGGTPVSVLLYVESVDTVFQQAVSSGAKAVRPPQDMFYGDRTSWVIDPFGHSWYIHTHVKDVSAEEMQSAMSARGQ